MSGYGQTIYVNGSAPPRTAANLNKTEAGVNAALGYDSLQEIRDIGAPTNSVETYLARGHSVCGDGGAGLFFVQRGAPGTFVDDDGYTILFSGSDGSVAAVRSADYVTPEMFGCVADATWTGTDWTGTDCTARLQAMDDAAAAHGLDVQCKAGFYYVLGTIKKNNAVNWSSGQVVYSASDDAKCFALCPSHTVTSERDPVTGKWSNGVIEMDYENAVDGNYFADVWLRGINIFGTPSDVPGVDNQCPRVGIALQNKAEFHVKATLRGLRAAIGSCGWIDGSFDGLITFCGVDAVDPADNAYALDLRTDLRVETQQPGFGDGEWEIRGTNALTFSGRMIHNPLWWDIYSFNSSGGIRFFNMKIEETDRTKIGIAADGGRNNVASHVRSRTGDVYYYGGTSFRSFEDANSRYLMQISNSRTVYTGVGFLAAGRFVLGVGSGLVITSFTSQADRADKTIFSLPAGSVMADGKIEQTVAGLDERKFAAVTGNNVNVSGLNFTTIGTPTTIPIDKGPLFLINAGLIGIDIEYAVDNDDYSGKAATISGGTGEYADEFKEIKVCRQGANQRTWTDADWELGGEIYGAVGSIIRQRERCFEFHYFNPQDAAHNSNKIIQGFLGERVTFAISPDAAYSYTIPNSISTVLNGGVDCVLGVDASYLSLECVGGDVWIEVVRS